MVESLRAAPASRSIPNLERSMGDPVGQIVWGAATTKMALIFAGWGSSRFMGWRGLRRRPTLGVLSGEDLVPVPPGVGEAD